MGLRDDVVVRVRPAREGARVDVRSASRYGYTDLGANAERVEALLDDIETVASVTERPRGRRSRRPSRTRKRPISVASGSGRGSMALRRWRRAPRATRSSRWARVDRPAAPASRGSSPI